MASFDATINRKKKKRETVICPGALNSSQMTERDSDRNCKIFRGGKGVAGPFRCALGPPLRAVRRVRDVPPTVQRSWLRHRSGQAKLLFKRFSWRHKGLLTSLMPPFNTELFRILSRLCFYSEWQATFPLGKSEKCFYFPPPFLFS